MRAIPDALAAALAGPARTLATAWRLTRRDGAVQGFTDHDAALTFAGTRFAAASGWTATEAEGALGFGIDTREVAGALSSAAIRAADLLAGRYDGARVEIFAVDWRAPDAHLLLDTAELGEVRRGGLAFAAELHGLTARLERPRGRLYRRRCDAELGDARCGVDRDAPRFARSVTVLERRGAVLRLAGAEGLEPERFAGGRIAFTGGAAAGLSRTVALLRPGASGGPAEAVVMEAEDLDIAGDAPARLTAGCDRSFATCREVFANQLNFRGFPHIPGSELALGVAKSDGLNDGGPVVP